MHEAPKAMPTCVHDWVGFYYALLDIDNGSIVWTGQNADAFYNFSPTEKFSFSPHGIAQWFKRFYLSEAYLESLPDINGKAGLTSKLLARCGLMMFSLYFRGEKLSLPKSFLELEQRFSNSDDFLILRESDNLKEDKSVLRKTLQLNCSEAFNDLLRVKVDHCHGGHVQAINSAAELKGSNAVFPYSSCRMMSWFESFPRGWADVNRPKRFIYKYIDELSQEFGSRLTNFDPPKKDTSFAQKVTIKSLYGYFKELLESQFGRSLIKESKIPEDSIGLFPDDMRKYEYILRHWWIEKLRELYIE